MATTDSSDEDEAIPLSQGDFSTDVKPPGEDVGSTVARRRQPLLSEVEERGLWARWRESRDNSARSALILGYLWLVRQIASSLLKKIGSAYLELRDMIQWGTVGLIEAVERFEPDTGVVFPAYATKRIRGAILNDLERNSEYHAQYTIRNRRARDRIQHMSPAKDGRTHEDLFEEMAQLAVGLAVGFMLDGTSLFQAPEEQNSPYNTPGELLAASDAFAVLVDQLPPQERQLVELHYQDGMEFGDIATVMNLTRSRISQIHTKAMNRLRKLFTNRRHLDVQI